MGFIDFVILALTVAGLIVGYLRGLVKRLCSLAAFLLGIGACHMFGDSATELFRAIFPESESWVLAETTTKVCAYILLFLFVSLSVRVAGFFVRQIINVSCMGPIDKVGGMGMGALKYLFALSALLNMWFAISPSSEMFSTTHMLDNKPFEFTMKIAPAVLGLGSGVSDSLAVDNGEPIENEDINGDEQR